MNVLTPRRHGLVAVVSLLLSLVLVVGRTQAPARAGESPRGRMLRLTNDSRAERDLDPLKLNVELSAAALRHSRDMAKKGKLFHSSNVPSELSPWRWSTWGENVGYTTADLAELQRAFMNSPDHRANILDPDFRKVGIGVVRRDGYLWVTVIFYG